MSDLISGCDVYTYSKYSIINTQREKQLSYVRLAISNGNKEQYHKFGFSTHGSKTSLVIQFLSKYRT